MFLTLNEKFWVSLIIQDISQILFGSIASYSQCFCLSAIYRYRNLYRPIPITIPIPIYRPIPIPKLYRSHTGIQYLQNECVYLHYLGIYSESLYILSINVSILLNFNFSGYGRKVKRIREHQSRCGLQKDSRECYIPKRNPL